MKNINAFIKTLIILTPLLLVFIIAGCNKEPEYIPGAGIQGIREPIFRILLSPVAYDGAIVVIEGVVQDFSEQKETDSANADDLEATFKLFDAKGSYINIRMPGQWEIVDNDFGHHRLGGQKFGENFQDIRVRQRILGRVDAAWIVNE